VSCQAAKLLLGLCASVHFKERNPGNILLLITSTDPLSRHCSRGWVGGYARLS